MLDFVNPFMWPWWLVMALLYVLLYALPALFRPFYKASSPRVVLVTGASGGLGKLTASAIAKEWIPDPS